jgi:hypothetical protein
LAEWIRRRATGLLLRPIEDDPAPTRITYDPGDGCSPEYGVVALARALEHINLAWALIGWMLRLPGIAWLAQRVADSLDPQNEATCELRVMTGVSQ